MYMPFVCSQDAQSLVLLCLQIRDHEWRRYWGDFVEAARAARGWPENSVDGDVNYEWQKDYMHFMFNLMDTNGEYPI